MQGEFNFVCNGELRGGGSRGGGSWGCGSGCARSDDFASHLLSFGCLQPLGEEEAAQRQQNSEARVDIHFCNPSL